MEVLKVFILIYTIIITILFIFHIKRSTINFDSELTDLNKKVSKEDNSLKTIKTILKIKKLQIKESPWYVKSISTIGIAIFFSMLITTIIQIIQNHKISIKNEEMKTNLVKFNKKNEKLENVIKDVSKTVYDIHLYKGYLIKDIEEILKYRIETIEKNKNLTLELKIELFRLYFFLEDYKSSILYITPEVLSFLKKSTPSAMITLAQYYYIVNDIENLKKYIKIIKPKKSSLSISWQKELIILEYLIDQANRKKYIKELSLLLKIPNESANKILFDIQLDKLHSSNK